MEEFRPVLFEHTPIEVPQFRFLRLALNQHMPRVEKWSEHRHPFHQALLYLRGQGTQHFGDGSIRVERGDWLVIPPECPHRFSKERTVRPVCLVIDFETKREDFAVVQQATLSTPQLAEAERLLVELNSAESKREKPTLKVSALVLGIAALLEETLSGGQQRGPGPAERSVRRTIDTLEEETRTPREVARRLGVTLDHLNRRLQLECGQTVGGLIRQERLDKAGQLLRDTNLSVGEIAARIGLPDQNYFGRWFRKYTGQSPSHWREAMRE